MVTSQREEWASPHIIALVELDLQKMRVRIVLAREAIRKRLRELKDLSGATRGTNTSLAAGGSFQVGQTAKARSGYRVQSLRKGRDRQCRTYLIQYPPSPVVKIARLRVFGSFGISGGMP
jgi:hypothetical protein